MRKTRSTWTFLPVFIISLSVSTILKTSFESPEIWGGKSNFSPENYIKKSTNVSFCDNSFDKSFVRPLCTTPQCFEFEKKWQKIAQNCYFLPFFFKFKILWYPTQWSDNHKFHRQSSLGSKLKICGRNCHKNKHLLIFDDFWWF